MYVPYWLLWLLLLASTRLYLINLLLTQTLTVNYSSQMPLILNTTIPCESQIFLCSAHSTFLPLIQTLHCTLRFSMPQTLDITLQCELQIFCAERIPHTSNPKQIRRFCRPQNGVNSSSVGGREIHCEVTNFKRVFEKTLLDVPP